MLRVHQQAGVDELIGEQRTIAVGKNGLQFQSAGGGIDLIVQSQQRATGEFSALVAIERVHAQRCPLRNCCWICGR